MISRYDRLPIPKIIHLIWVGPNPFPYEENKATWLRQNPDWELMFWTDDNLPKMRNRWIYDLMPHHAFKADILRFEILYQFGGVYSDADSYCARPLESLLEGVECFAMTSTNPNDTIEVSTMGCTTKHPAFERAVYEYEEYILGLIEEANPRGYSPHIVCGKRYVQSKITTDPTFKLLDDTKNRKHICVYHGNLSTTNKPYRELCPETYICHTNDNTWVRDGSSKIYLRRSINNKILTNRPNQFIP